MRTTYLAKNEDTERKWYIIDATGKPLGRLATLVATILRGKHKPTFTPYVDTGDHVIVINADKVVLTGKKATQKFWHRHSGYPGGHRSVSYGKLLEDRPEKAVEIAVKGMLPHTRLGRRMFRKLRVYRTAEHPHAAQKPEIYHEFVRREG